MFQVRTRGFRLARPRLAALVCTAVMALGLSLVGVAYAEDYRDRDGDRNYRGLSSGSRDGQRDGQRLSLIHI